MKFRFIIAPLLLLLLSSATAQEEVSPPVDWDDETPWGGHVPGLSWEDPTTVDCRGRAWCEEVVSDAIQEWEAAQNTTGETE